MDKVRAKIDFDSQFTKHPPHKKKTRKGTQIDCCDDLEVDVSDLQRAVINSFRMVRDNLNSQNDDIVEMNDKIKKCEYENIKLKVIVEINDDNNVILSNEQLKTMNDLKTNLPADEYKEFDKEVNYKLKVNRYKKCLAYFELLIPVLGGIVAFLCSVTRFVGVNLRVLNIYTNTLNGFTKANKERIVSFVKGLSSVKAPFSKATKTTVRVLKGLDDENIMKADEYLGDEQEIEKIQQSDNDKIHNIFARLANFNYEIKKSLTIPSANDLRLRICNNITIAVFLFTFIMTIDIYTNANFLTSALASFGVDCDFQSGGGGKKNKKKQKKSLKYYNDLFIKSLEHSIKG